MPPYSNSDDKISLSQRAERESPHENKKLELLWKNVVICVSFHLMALYGVYVMFSSARIYTLLFAYVLNIFAGLGITAGAHRLWSHRSYKAKWPLRALLVACNCLSLQTSVIHWSRDHRGHHKFSETEADPHNAKRGFFFSHVGWLLCKKQPEVIEKGKELDLSDLYADPLLVFQDKHFLSLGFTFCFVFPLLPPIVFWGETFSNSFAINILRYVYSLNITWLVNSAAHMFGHKPYDRNINPAENRIVGVLALGEGWHNYHHTFPWDYKASELGKYSSNFTAGFIDFCAKIGLAYDLKTVSMDMVKKRVQRTGDGTHEVWGWGDKDQPKEDYEEATIMYKER